MTAPVWCLRLADAAQSAFNRSVKAFLGWSRYGSGWRDSVRTGRRFVRVQFAHDRGWQRVLNPGWSWNCQNCKTFSHITAADMPEIISRWERDCEMLRLRGLERQIRRKPTPATVGCTNCRYLPGPPE